MTYPFQPRLIRLRDAPLYLGMDRNRFNKKVRPGLTEIPIGEQGIAFDRLDLDAWVEEYKSRNGRPAVMNEGEKSWDAKRHQDSINGMESGILINKSKDLADFEKVVKQAATKKRSRF